MVTLMCTILHDVSIVPSLKRMPVIFVTLFSISYESHVYEEISDAVDQHFIMSPSSAYGQIQDVIHKDPSGEKMPGDISMTFNSAYNLEDLRRDEVHQDSDVIQQCL